MSDTEVHFMNIKKPFLCVFLSSLALSLSLGAAFATNEMSKVNAATPSPETYWNTWISNNQAALNAGGTTLVTALKQKITQVADGKDNTVSYNGLWSAYKESDSVPGSNGAYIWDMYGGFQYTYQSSGKSYSKEGDCYNREHSIPKSWFGEAKPAYSDLIHLVPTDGKVNGMRSNYTFGEVQSTSVSGGYSYSFPARSYNSVQYQTAGVSKLGSPKAIDGQTTTQTLVFEPDDQYKGDFARIYMYFAVRYGGGSCAATKTQGASIFTSTFTNSNPYVTDYGKKLLAKWHVQDPVSEKETIRNNAVEKLQGNRNPFVDFPEWANGIFGSDYSTVGVRISKTALTLLENQSETITATSSDSSPITWTTSNAAVAEVNNGKITAKSVGNAIIRASATIDEVEYYKECSVTVNKAVELSELSTSGQKTEYYIGDKFSYDGTCTAHYTNGDTKTVVPSVDSSKVDMTKEGEYHVNLGYTEGDIHVSCGYDIVVKAQPVDPTPDDPVAPDNPNQQSNLPLWVIVLIIVGGFVLIVGIALAVFLIVRKKHKSK